MAEHTTKIKAHLQRRDHCGEGKDSSTVLDRTLLIKCALRVHEQYDQVFAIPVLKNKRVKSVEIGSSKEKQISMSCVFMYPPTYLNNKRLRPEDNTVGVALRSTAPVKAGQGLFALQPVLPGGGAVGDVVQVTEEKVK